MKSLKKHIVVTDKRINIDTPRTKGKKIVWDRISVELPKERKVTQK